ncbi:MAG: SIS domain-containing protein, partial [Planctomycetota bacterium]
MTAKIQASPVPWRVMDEQVREFARQVIDAEASAVRQMREAIDDAFVRAVDMVLSCRGALVLSGVGKAGHVARKLSATFASTGTPSHFLSPGDALHGDLGSVRDGDLVLLLSGSGETEEILRILDVVRRLGRPVIAMTRGPDNTLGKDADCVLSLGRVEEACPLKLAPTCSTTA